MCGRLSQCKWKAAIRQKGKAVKSRRKALGSQPCPQIYDPDHLVAESQSIAARMATKTSPFLYPGSVSTVDRLSIVHLKRDLQIPTILKDRDEDDEGYSEGKVVNTRFGSFPHSTLIGLPWGTQVRASKVDTGSRGRRVKGQDKKRKREESEGDDISNKNAKLDEVEDAADASTPTTTREEGQA